MLGRPHYSVFMVSRGINSIKLQLFLVGNVNDVVLGSGRNYNCCSVLNPVFVTVDNAFSFSFLKAEKLVVVGMNLHADFFFWLQAH